MRPYTTFQDYNGKIFNCETGEFYKSDIQKHQVYVLLDEYLKYKGIELTDKNREIYKKQIVQTKRIFFIDCMYIFKI